MIFPDYFSRYANDWGSWILLSATGLILLRKFQSWYRLRHFKGPFIASLTRLWLVRCITGGRMHLDFQEVNQKYGMCGYVMTAMEKISRPMELTKHLGTLARVGPNDLITSDPAMMRRMSAVRSTYRRSEWYIGVRFNPGRDNIVSVRDEDQHNKLRSMMAAGVS